MTALEVRLEQALGNLLDNALRHGTATDMLAARSGERILALIVRDEGAGFPAQFLPHAYEGFTREAEQVFGSRRTGMA